MFQLWYGNFITWELAEKVTFDGANRLIIVNPGVQNLNIKADVYSAWKRRIVNQIDFGGFPSAMRSVGGDPTVAGQRAGEIFFMVNGWRIVIDFATTTVVGAIYSDDFDTPFINSDGVEVYAAQVASTVTTVVETVPVVDPNMLAAVATSAEVAAVDGKVDGVRTVVDGTDTKVDTLDTKVDDVPTNVWNHTQ